ncbi:MAG TPA: 16S rRNA (cytidine(1402)-2'-O)-methyltransferase [Bryobacteraceae bacterium]|jgi:16S rRNA (cytidine1402-2'-O)-methyltransferase
MSGILYVVATPIGNLEDITYRAVRILGEVNWIACEDTRQTRKLLEHYRIETPQISYHEHNEMERARELTSRLLADESGALVSDAGVPLISDPGYRLVHAAVGAGIVVQPVPGASAALAALSASGLPTDSFHFAGFLPPKPGQRVHALEALKNEHATLIFYEAPHRLMESLADIQSVLGDRDVVVAREITKIHEEFLHGTASELRTQLAGRDAIKGEVTVLVAKAMRPEVDDRPIEVAVEAQMRSGLSRMDAIKAVAKSRGLSKRDVYREFEHLPQARR